MSQMRETPGGIDRRLLRALEIPVGIVVIGMMLLVTVNALGRRLIGIQIPGTLELTQFWLMPFIAALGIFIAQLRKQHVAADLFYHGFSDTQKKWLSVATYVLTAVVMGAFSWYGLDNALEAMRVEQKAGATSIPSWPAYFVIPLAFGALTVALVVEAVRAIRSPASLFATDLGEEAADEVAEIAAQDVTGSIRVPDSSSREERSKR